MMDGKNGHSVCGITKTKFQFQYGEGSLKKKTRGLKNKIQKNGIIFNDFFIHL